MLERLPEQLEQPFCSAQRRTEVKLGFGSQAIESQQSQTLVDRHGS